jgi:hypothetical protein
MVAFCVVAMAALALEALARARDAEADRRAAADARDRLDLVPWIGGAVVVIAFLGAALGGQASAAAGWMRFAVFAAGAAATLWAWTSRRLGPVAAMWMLAAVTTLDLWVIGKKFFYTIPAPSEYYAEDDVAGFLQSKGGPWRTWAPRGQSAWPREVNYPMLFGIDQAGGEHGNQMQSYNEFVGAGEGTTPDFHNFLQDPRFINADNVRWLVISQEVGAPWLREAYRSQAQQAIVYENVNALPRAWVVGQAIRATHEQSMAAMQSPAWDPRKAAVVESPRDLALAGAQLQGAAQVTRSEPERVEVTAQANGAGLLVLADNWYPDWKATVDGRPAEVYRTNHTFRGVVLPAGRHRVVFTFDSPAVHTGFLIYLATLIVLAAYGVWLLVAWRRGRGDVAGQAAAVPEPAPAG